MDGDKRDALMLCEEKQRLKKLMTRGAIGVAGGCTGVFLVIRLKAFLIQAFSLELPLWTLGIAILLLMLVAALAAEPVLAFLNRWAMFPSVSACVIYGISLLIMYPMRGILIGRALENSGVGMSAITQGLYLLGGGILLGTFLLCTVTAIRSGLRWVKYFCMSIDHWDLLFLLVLLLGINLLVWAYAVHSSTIYFWDNAGYWTISHQLAQLWQTEGMLALLRSVFDSVLTQDYNYLIAIPAAVLTRFFGESRYVFLAAIANFGFYPVCILVWVLAKCVGRYPKLVTAAVLMAVPMLLRLVLGGYVDVGGCFFTLAAMLVWYADRGRNNFGYFIIVGICLAVAVLLRRWYAFYALSFVLALAIECLCFRRSAVPLAGTLAAFAFVLVFWFQPLVSGRLMADYASIYEAYALGIDRDFMLLFYYYGFLILLAVLAVGVAFLCKRESRRTGTFILAQMVLCFLLFTRVQTHDPQHLLLYAPAQICLLTLGIHKIWGLCRRRMTVAILIIAMLPSLSPFLPREKPGSIEEIRYPAPLPAFLWEPPQRADAMDVVALACRLDEFGAAGKTVGLLASSYDLNREILLNAETSLSLARDSNVDRAGYLTVLPQVDQRDGWQDVLFQCDVLVVADPVQLHLEQENQAVVYLPAQALLSGEGFAAAYEKLDEAYTLANGIQVYIYERTREPSQEEQEQLRGAFYALHP